MDYKLTIRHKLPSEKLAEEMLVRIKASNLLHSQIVWACNWLWAVDDSSLGYGEFHLDVLIPLDNTEEACREILSFFGDEYCGLHLSSPSGWKAIHEDSNKKKSSVWDLSASKEQPNDDKELYISNTPMYGGMVVGRRFDETQYEDIKRELEEMGFFNLKPHTKEKNCYKIDFDTYKISGKDLVNRGWFLPEFGSWNKRGKGISMEYPKESLEGRDSDNNWYEPHIEYEVHQVRQNTFYDYSGDDSSLNPSLW